MKIMIFGDVATGKSTFAKKLGKSLNIPVIHLDKVMDDIGRDNNEKIKEVIFSEADKGDWIIEGNAFSRDPDGYRISRADKIIVFKSSRIRSFIFYIIRYLKVKAGFEKRKGSETARLNLKFYVPYIFWQFPRGMDWALMIVRKQGKQPILVKNFREARNLLERLS